jgi:hypothetical protein
MTPQCVNVILSGLRPCSHTAVTGARGRHDIIGEFMKFFPLVAAAAALLASSSAHAACKLASMDLPVTVDGQRALVTAKIGGKPLKLILDSGAFFSALDVKFIAGQKLQSEAFTPTGSHLHADAEIATSGVAGKEQQTGLATTSIEFGGTTFVGLQFLTAPGLDHGAAGLLGQNFLHQADDEYDLKNGLVRVVRPSDCGKSDLAYWVKSGDAYSILPLEPTDRVYARTTAIIWINGERMRALFDTGAPTSFITARDAARAGVKTTDPGVKPAGSVQGLDGEVKAWVAPFASIKIGDEEIKNTQLTVGESKAEDFDVLIGADFFLAHHVYVANSQGKLYFSYSGGPVFRLAAGS